MRHSDSKLEVNRLHTNLKNSKKSALRIVDFCARALMDNKNFSMNCAQLKTALLKLGYKTDSKTLENTLSTVLRYQNYGLVDKPRNAKFRLKRSVVKKLSKRTAKRKLNAIFNSKK